jgi:hypothetical protein
VRGGRANDRIDEPTIGRVIGLADEARDRATCVGVGRMISECKQRLQPHLGIRIAEHARGENGGR